MRSTSGKALCANICRALRVSARVRRPQVLGGVLVLVIAVVGVIALANEGGPAQEPGGHEHCFAEWCIAPRSATIGIESLSVNVVVRSDAKQSSQRPDHPQAWVIDGAGRQIGGPQPSLDGVLEAGDSYVANLTFSTSEPGTCPRLLVAEGGWPSFLGLGYAPSPFTARAEWRLCDIAGSLIGN
jgi:hypothetical protein